MYILENLENTETWWRREKKTLNSTIHKTALLIFVCILFHSCFLCFFHLIEMIYCSFFPFTLNLITQHFHMFFYKTLHKYNSYWLWRRLSTEELMLLNCGVGEDSWESLGLQGDPTSPFWRRSTLGFLWKEWC